MKIIVTGGCGFIGSNLIEILLKDAENEVVAIDNLSVGRLENIEEFKGLGNFTFVKADLSLRDEGWEKYFIGADWVIHLAALADIVPSIESPESYFYSNVLGTLNVLTTSRREGVKRFVYAASSSCYGIPAQYPTPETAPINPEYPYALTKYQGEELVLHWAKLYKLPAVALRFFNVYGPRARTSGTYGAMFGVFLAQKFAGKPFTVVGDGTQTRDFTYVTDVCEAIIEVANNPSLSGAYNVGSGQTVSVNKIVKLLGGESVFIPKRPGEPDATFADISKILQATSWRPKISIERGVEEMLKRIDQWSSAPVWTDSKIAVATKDWFKYLG